MKIVVVGAGYVGLANAVLLAKKHEVLVLDIDHKRVAAVNERISPLDDVDIKKAFANDRLDLIATTDASMAYAGADLIVVATPTNFDTIQQSFDTSSVEEVVVAAVKKNPKAIVVIKSTVPIGFTDSLCAAVDSGNVIFCPEFLREGQALHDCYYPSRIVVGDKSSRGLEVGRIFLGCAKNSDVKIILSTNSEAESIKLFSNTYLAMRVAFFNELDSFALKNGISSRSIIDGVCLDSRIGNSYNNPSFGYGGYCLPKDTRQLLSNYENTPQNLIKAIVESNETRRDYMCEIILASKPRVIGFYRLVMKTGSENFRSSAVIGLMERLQQTGRKIVVYEPLLSDAKNLGLNTELYSNLENFKMDSDIILANRITSELEDVKGKLFSRDLFGNG
ncbi:nucleotide sugar dehydrogenase [Variovorax boronicumulans]|uniref:nucleotide sugar dehydrogenase n=1 Tax=Variovorax boronicumulans TaxID=436515 RepID=UPI00085CAF86|nr:nucleotide sugar dehydrogenase [Variovorax boronicumulans]OEZ27275.1 UDP-glucose 6-dehydrogenase [Variovorax boronicumulans]